MNYKIRCPHCKKKVTVSTREAITVEDRRKIIHWFMECPKCEEEIDTIPLRQPRRGNAENTRSRSA